MNVDGPWRISICLQSDDKLLIILLIYPGLLNDVIAGLTLGIMLIPQSLAYAEIATIPVQFGLMSSWLPATLYAFMGTSKGKRLTCCYRDMCILTLI